jgi:hypothetical protein
MLYSTHILESINRVVHNQTGFTPFLDLLHRLPALWAKALRLGWRSKNKLTCYFALRVVARWLKVRLCPHVRLDIR